MNEIKLRHQDAYDRLKAQLPIDVTDLDGELIQLAITQMEISELTSEASDYKDATDHIVEVVTAESSQTLRMQLDKKGNEPSEASIKSKVLLFEELQKAHEAARVAKYELELWKGLSKSYGTKVKSIEKVCDLVLKGYTTPDRYMRKEHAKERAKQRDD